MGIWNGRHQMEWQISTSQVPYHIEIVRNRSRRTLKGVINQRLVGQNPTVHTDLWQGYAILPLFVLSCVVHERVNHSQNFVVPITGAHIQGMDQKGVAEMVLKKGEGKREERYAKLCTKRP